MYNYLTIEQGAIYPATGEIEVQIGQTVDIPYKICLSHFTAGGGKVDYLVKNNSNSAYYQFPKQIPEDDIVRANFYLDESSHTLSNEIGTTLVDESEACDANEPDLNSYIIASQFIMDEDYCFYGQPYEPNNFIFLQAGAEMIIEEGATIIMENMDIFSCDKLWKSIIVEAGGTLILKNCDVRDGEYAIDVHQGGTVSFNGNTFDDNYVSIRIGQDFDPNESGIHLSLFNANTFQSTNGLKPHYSSNPPYGLFDPTKPYAGVIVKNQVKPLNLSGVLTVEWVGSNVFTDLTNGIISTGSNVMINYNKYKNILPEIGPEPLFKESFSAAISVSNKGSESKIAIISGLDDYDFKNCRRGISARSMHIGIGNNDMDQMEEGILISHNQSLQSWVINNNIEAEISGMDFYFSPSSIGIVQDNFLEIDGNNNYSTGIRINEIQHSNNIWQIIGNTIALNKAYSGISMRNTSNYDLKNNTVYLFEDDNEKHYGIKSEKGENNLFSCNYVYDDANDGVNAEGITFQFASEMNSDILCNEMDEARILMNFLGQNMVNVKGNEFGNNKLGLLLGDYSAEDQELWIGEQLFSGNKWNETSATINAYSSAHDLLKPLSRFEVDYDANTSYYWPYDGNDPVDEDWFKKKSSQNTYECSTSECPDGIGSQWVKSEISEAIIEDSTINTLDEDLLYGLRLDLKRQMEISGFDTSHAVLDSFFLSSSSYDEFNDLRFDFELLYDSAFQELNTGSIGLWMDSVRNMLDTVYAHFILSDSTDLDTMIIDAVDSLTLYSSFIPTLVDSTEYSNLRSDLNSLDEDNDYQEVFKKIYHLVLLNSIDSLNETDTLLLERLDSLALLCPDDYGHIVYLARSLNSKYNPQSYDSIQCSTIIPRKTREQEKLMDSDLLVFPNPGTSNIQIQNSQVFDKVCIYNLLGQKLISLDYENVTHANLELKGLLPGSYIITIEYQDMLIASSLFIKSE